MSDTKLVKVDNWGIYFLQRLKHFFNRTDYCDLTLQFQDNAQLKVHRLVLSACTEYFELLERTCEMYEDCLVMPDDLQADVVVPIINFMYTGQLEFRMDLLEKLYQTSIVMCLPVLTKLLDSHRKKRVVVSNVSQSYPVRRMSKQVDSPPETSKQQVISTPTTKRSYSKAFDKITTIYRDKKVTEIKKKGVAVTDKGIVYRPPSPIPFDTSKFKRCVLGDPRPTRYELPEELDTDNIFENSFCNISYTSQPLMIHPETRKQYTKRPRQIGESRSKRFSTSTVDIVECKKITKDTDDNIFEDSMVNKLNDESDMFQSFVKVEAKDPSQLFDQILDQSDDPRVTIETPKNKKSPNTANLDHAKIISEVLKKYPHLVKSNKNIKLKILNTPTKTTKRQKSQVANEKSLIKNEPEPDCSYETEVIDSKQAAKLIAMGAENIEGPWICLICGTPGKALHFTSYYKYRRHLVDVHHEKPVLTICEYCGQRTTKRNFLLHHMYTKHGVEPPPTYNFPKCNQCSYIALTEALLVKHKLSHSNSDGRFTNNYVALTEALNVKQKSSESNTFHCNICPLGFNSANQLLTHIQTSGHKYKKPNLQCIYCTKVFLRESNLYAHLKTNHKNEAKRDGIFDDSEDEYQKETTKAPAREVKSETSINEYDENVIQYQIQQGPDGIHVVTKKQSESPNTKQKILNTGYNPPPPRTQKTKATRASPSVQHQNEFIHEIPVVSETHEEIIMIDNNEYVVRGNKLIPKKEDANEFLLHNAKSNEDMEPVPDPLEITAVQSSKQQDQMQHPNMILKDSSNINQPIPIYVSNEEEYKALMSSNHPIIFDTTDSNKTLTVLTTPHGSTLETATIDLDPTQTNDMMIIQDDYPLNVSEGVATDNNIVVVYSHQVDDQNKDYHQLLTSQGMETQFVQTSAIITQNFETVSTSTPVMSAHVLEAQVDGTWQTNIHQNVSNHLVEMPGAELQQIVHAEQVEMTNASEDVNDMSELPEVQILPITNQETQNNDTILPTLPTEVSGNENFVENIEHMDDDGDNIEATESVTPDDTEAPTKPTEDDNITSDNPIETISEQVNLPNQEEAPTIEEAIIPPVSEPEQQIIVQQSDETDNQETENHNEIIENSELNTEQTFESTHITEPADEPEEINATSDEPVLNNVTNTTEALEKIQSLTSDWSEDESDSPQDVHVKNNNKMETEIMGPDIITPEDEESIENIQQEVVKNMSETQLVVTNSETMETDQDNEPTETEEATQPEEKCTENIVPETSKEKITSLLNDWEDNDSQENVSINDNENHTEPNETTTDLESTPKENSIEILPKKDENKEDNIKSLVSDWDEEDEENK